MKCLISFAALTVCAFLSACAPTSYMAPGRAADMTLFTGDARDALTDASIRQVLHRPILAQLPASLAIARVQDAGYRSYSARGWGQGRYSVVTTRDVESDEDLERLADLEGIDAASRVGRLLLPDRLSDDRELRAAAASLGADLLLVYTFDTTFHTEDGFAPLTVVSLGLFPTKTARVSSTASAVLLDTRSGHVFAAWEGDSHTWQLANIWTSRAAVDQSRRRAEKQAWEHLLGAAERMWPGVARRIATAPAPTFTEPPGPTTWLWRPAAPPPPKGPTYRTDWR